MAGDERTGCPYGVGFDIHRRTTPAMIPREQPADLHFWVIDYSIALLHESRSDEERCRLRAPGGTEQKMEKSGHMEECTDNDERSLF